MVTVVWTELALFDLQEIHDFIRKDSIRYADRQIEKIITKVDQLIQFPNLGKQVPEFSRKDIREIVSGNYRIIYLLNDKAIFILRINHGARVLRRIK